VPGGGKDGPGRAKKVLGGQLPTLSLLPAPMCINVMGPLPSLLSV